MSYKIHMKNYENIRTLYQTDSLYAWKHDTYFPPVMVEISPTNICNQKCRYCYVNKGSKSGEILEDNILISIFKQVIDTGVKAILIQGIGEPLMHIALPMAIEIGAKYHSPQIPIGLVTNGVLLNKDIQKRILKHLSFVKFSVIDINTERYAYLHNCSKNQLKMLIKNIKNAIDLREKNNLDIALWASVYIEKNNFYDMYNIIDYYKNLGLDYIIVQEATYTELSPAGKREKTSSNFSDKEINELKRRLLVLNDDKFHVKIRFPINDDTYCVGATKEYWKNNLCHGTKFYSIISSDGQVYPCWRAWGNKEYSYGSIYEKSFEEIWKGSKRKEIDYLINNTPPLGDECSVCNIGKLNKILNEYQEANINNKWINFLM